MNRLQKELQASWRRFHYFFHWQRLLGLALTALLGYLLVFVVLGKTDVSWMVSKGAAYRFHWPDLPRFFVRKETTSDGREETVYSVPSRQLTAQELAQLSATNQAPAHKN
jgi:hypothetical protein